LSKVKTPYFFCSDKNCLYNSPAEYGPDDFYSLNTMGRRAEVTSHGIFDFESRFDFFGFYRNPLYTG